MYVAFRSEMLNIPFRLARWKQVVEQRQEGILVSGR